MKKLFILLLACIFLLSCAMCATLAYDCRDMLCQIEHNGASAPVGIVLLEAIPFVLLIAGFTVSAVICYKKAKGENNQWQK